MSKKIILVILLLFAISGCSSSYKFEKNQFDDIENENISSFIEGTDNNDNNITQIREDEINVNISNMFVSKLNGDELYLNNPYEKEIFLEIGIYKNHNLQEQVCKKDIFNIQKGTNKLELKDCSIEKGMQYLIKIDFLNKTYQFKMTASTDSNDIDEKCEKVLEVKNIGDINNLNKGAKLLYGDIAKMKDYAERNEVFTIKAKLEHYPNNDQYKFPFEKSEKEFYTFKCDKYDYVKPSSNNYGLWIECSPIMYEIEHPYYDNAQSEIYFSLPMASEFNEREVIATGKIYQNNIYKHEDSFFISQSQVYIGEKCDTEIDKSETLCLENDKGLNEYTKSDIVFKNKKVEDYCDSSNFLTEYFCQDDNRGYDSKKINCEFGCEDGACLRRPITDDQPKCVENDDGIDKYKVGSLVFDKKHYIDYCDSDKFLKEFFCQEDKKDYESKKIECEFGCKNGACLTKPIIEEVPKCVEGDSGIDKYTDGSIVFDKMHYRDYCNSKTFLTEYFCQENNRGVSSKKIECEFGCENRACLEAEKNEDCYESDDGVDPYNNGNIIGYGDLGSIYEDEIMNTTDECWIVDGVNKGLTEMSCQGNRVVWQHASCDYWLGEPGYCENGACIPEEESCAPPGMNALVIENIKSNGTILVRNDNCNDIEINSGYITYNSTRLNCEIENANAIANGLTEIKYNCNDTIVPAEIYVVRLITLYDIYIGIKRAE